MSKIGYDWNICYFYPFYCSFHGNTKINFSGRLTFQLEAQYLGIHMSDFLTDDL